MIKVEQLQINDIVLCKEGKKIFPVKVNLPVLVDISLHPKKYFPVEITKEFFEKNKFEKLYPEDQGKTRSNMYIVHKDFFGNIDLIHWCEEKAIVLVHKDKDGTIRRYQGFECRYLHNLQQFLRNFDDYKVDHIEAKFII